MRSDALARRIRIIEAACEIFRTSTDIVPLETIADKAGVGIATLYRNFPDRTALIHACAAYMFDKVIELQQSVLERFDSNPEAEWFRYVKTLVDLGIAPLVSALAPDDFQDIPAEIHAHPRGGIWPRQPDHGEGPRARTCGGRNSP